MKLVLLPGLQKLRAKGSEKQHDFLLSSPAVCEHLVQVPLHFHPHYLHGKAADTRQASARAMQQINARRGPRY